MQLIWVTVTCLKFRYSLRYILHWLISSYFLKLWEIIFDHINKFFIVRLFFTLIIKFSDFIKVSINILLYTNILSLIKRRRNWFLLNISQSLFRMKILFQVVRVIIVFLSLKSALGKYFGLFCATSQCTKIDVFINVTIDLNHVLLIVGWSHIIIT